MIIILLYDQVKLVKVPYQSSACVCVCVCVDAKQLT